MTTYSKLPFDVIHHLSLTLSELDRKALREFSRVDKRTRDVCIPLLFERIVVIRGWGKDAIPWDGEPEAVKNILGNDTIVKSIKSLYFQIYIWGHKPEDFPIPVEIFELLFTLPNLTELAFLPHKEYLPQVKSKFENNTKLLLAVQSIRLLSPLWMFFSECCPNLKSLNLDSSTYGYYSTDKTSDIDMVRLGNTHPKLEELHCCDTDIAANLPRMRNVGLYGSYWNAGGILDHLHAYNAFKHLESVSLPDVKELGLGFCPPWCGTGMTQEDWARVDKQREEATAHLMDGFDMKVLKHKGSTLREVRIGSRYSGQTVWEKGIDERLYESKYIERSHGTYKVVAIKKVENATTETALHCSKS